MLTSFNVLNNVRTTLNAAIDADDTSIILNQASSPFKDPPAPAVDALGQASLLTLTDSLANPTKIEIVTYTGFTDNGNGTVTISGVTRGAENTVASAFSSGAYAYQAITVDCLNGPILNVDSNEGIVNITGFAADVPGSNMSGSNGHRVRYSGGIQTVIDCATSEHGYGQRIGAVVCLGDDFGILFPPAGDSSVDTRYPILLTNNTGYSTGDPIARIKCAETERIEMLQAARLRPSDQTSFDASSTIDWKEHDIRRMALTSNSVVTMTDTSDYITPGGEYRRLVLLISIPDVANPGYTITWPSNVKWAGGTAPTFNVGQNQIRKIEFLYNGTYYLGSAQETFQL